MRACGTPLPPPELRGTGQIEVVINSDRRGARARTSHSQLLLRVDEVIE